jgi:hypothetical protein
VKLDKDFPQDKPASKPTSSRLPSFEEKKVVIESIATPKSISEAVAAPAPVVPPSSVVAPATPVVVVAAPSPAIIATTTPSSSISSPRETLSTDQENELFTLRTSLNQKSLELDAAQSLLQSHSHEIQQLQKHILQLENQNLSSHTATATVTDADADLQDALAQLTQLKSQHEESINLKDQQMAELRMQLENEKKNSSREIVQLKELLEQDKQAENSDRFDSHLFSSLTSFVSLPLSASLSLWLSLL